MIKRLKPKSKFSRNVLTLMTGTTVAQVVPIAISPLLTRLYSPKDFGAYGVLMGLTIVLSIISTARFEQALFLVRNPKTMDLIVKFVLLNSFIFSVFLSILSASLGPVFLNTKSTLSTWHLYFLPVGVMTISSYTVLRAWLNRNAQYKAIRSNSIKQSIASSFLQLALGIAETFRVFGLITGDILGKASTTLLIAKRIDYSKTSLTRKLYTYFWKRYQDIALYQMPASLINTSARYAPMILLPILFDTATSGLFLLVFKVVMSPLTILGKAITDVFKVQAAESIQKKGECREEFNRAFKLLLPIAILIFLAIFFLSEPFFPIFYGTEWSKAGKMASIISLLAATRFLASPLSYVLILKERFRTNLAFQLLILLSTSGTILIGFYCGDFFIFLYTHSALTALIYISMLKISYNLSLGEKS